MRRDPAEGGLPFVYGFNVETVDSDERHLLIHYVNEPVKSGESAGEIDGQRSSLAEFQRRDFTCEDVIQLQFAGFSQQADLADDLTLSREFP